MNNVFDDALTRFQSRIGHASDGGSAAETAVAVVDKPTGVRDDVLGARRRYVGAVWQYLVSEAQENGRSIYIYGAGAHSEWLLSVCSDLPSLPIECFLDDAGVRDALGGHPVLRPEEAAIEDGSIVLISSDRYDEVLYARAKARFGDRLSIIRLYEGLPPGPYPLPPSPDELQSMVDATRRARANWGGADFVGPYERAHQVTGFLHEQWLWSQRHSIRGHVLDMSTPRYWHSWIYDLPSVDRVSISDRDCDAITKLGYVSDVGIRGDFCVDELPVEPNTFDTVVCASILEHCQDPWKMTANLNRLLARGGVLLVTVPYACVDGHCRPDFWRFGSDGLDLLAERAGFIKVQAGPLGDVGHCLDEVLGYSSAATDVHNGIPLLNWLSATKKA